MNQNKDIPHRKREAANAALPAGMCLLRRKRAAQPSMVSFKAGMGAVLPSRAMASVRL